MTSRVSNASFAKCGREEKRFNNMGIPNVKRYRILNEETREVATVMAVLPKNADLPAYLADASKRFDWAGWRTMQAASFKVRVCQQKQAKKK